MRRVALFAMKIALASLFFGPLARHAPLLHLHLHHAGVAILRLGGPCVSIARRRRFCAVAASVNSSLAPLSPRSRKRVTLRMRLSSSEERRVGTEGVSTCKSWC